jgi:TPP-dependent pyruvate/acetoin dehydrogenase alpha subunit
LIEAKTMRMTGHAQHDAAEYVPREMFEYWKARDPLQRYEQYLTGNRLWDEKNKADLDARVERELVEDLSFAENSAFPPPELAEQGVYCDGCHRIEADWRRPREEAMPPKSSVTAAWTVSDFGEVTPANGSQSPGQDPAQEKIRR